MFTHTMPAFTSNAPGNAPVVIDQRVTLRHLCNLEGVSRPLDIADTLSWGATVKDISSGGVGLLVCFPFRLGTYLALDLTAADGKSHSFMVRVVHVRDQMDGSWHLGCEFAKKLPDAEVAKMI